MYKRIDLTQLEGIGFTQDSLDWMQTSYRDALASLAGLLGDYVIISGVVLGGGSYSSGWVAINGEIMPLVGGLAAAQIIIEEVVTNEDYGDGSNKPAYYLRRAKLASSGGTAISSFVRLSTIKQIASDLSLKAPIASPAFTGIPSAPTASLGTNTTQLATTAFVKAAMTALVNGAPAALDTLIEFANAINNDPNFYADMVALIATKVNKAGDVMTGNLEVQGGVRTKSSGPYFKKDIIALPAWNMQVTGAGLQKSIAHGIANWKTIRVLAVMIANDADNTRSNLSDSSLIGGSWVQGGGVTSIDATNINIESNFAGRFYASAYTSTSASRGTMLIEYEA